MLRALLAKVDDGRFGRGVAGLRQGWKFNVTGRKVSTGELSGIVVHGEKTYLVEITRGRGRGGVLTGSCTCEDHKQRGVLCKHIAFAALWELGFRAAERSAHREVRDVG
jgi:uncharacterized Zn finger protein